MDGPFCLDSCGGQFYIVFFIATINSVVLKWPLLTISKCFAFSKILKFTTKNTENLLENIKKEKKICIVLLGRLFVFWSNKHLFFSMYLSVIKLRVTFCFHFLIMITKILFVNAIINNHSLTVKCIFLFDHVLDCNDPSNNCKGWFLVPLS